MIRFEDSLKIIEDLKITEYKIKTAMLMHTLGFVLAEDIIADHNSPELPTSAMDGYAIIHEDMALGRLKVSSINPAGSALQTEVIAGTCIKTFTGALMPQGADTLIPIENVRVEGDEIVIIQEVPQGFSVREVAENYAKDQKLISKGTKIDFPQIGVLSSLNISSIKIYEKPIVAIVSTGSELLELGEEQTNDAQIRSSNNYILEAIATKYDAVPLQLGCIKDDKATITNAISKALNEADIVVTTGGVSVGDFDFVKDVIYALDCEVLFKGVRVKPGQHIMVARKGDKFIIALPGFAYSATVTALLYLVPLIEKLQQGQSSIRKIKATLTEAFQKRSKKAEFTACNISLKNGKYFVDFKGKKLGSSAILTNMLGDVALLVTNEEETSKAIADEVNVLVFG
jgi:molybdopterin molybdotransferase